MNPADRTIEGRGTLTADSPRARAFCTPGGPEVFHAIAHRHEIWRPDPFDVETIHEEARTAFQSLVGRAATIPRPTSGRILLLTGESGSGKTHLMRAFRNWTHGRQRGYCGYMQMTSATDRYGRYVLNNLIDSLSQPYFEPHGETTGLTRLSTTLAESSRFIPSDRLAQLREDEFDAPCLARLIEALADQIVEDERLDDLDLDLVRALLYLQRDDPRVRGRVLKYLRCEDLSASDRHALGGLTPRAYTDAPERVIALLGHLMGAVEVVPLVLCIDQLEDMYNLDDAQARFRRAMSTVCDLADRIPSSVVVISCLEDFWDKLKTGLATPARARIEHDPRPIHLSSNRDVAEIVPLIAKRLEALYETHGVVIDEADPTDPIPNESLPALASLPTRMVLDWCREFRDRCIAAGAIVPDPDAIPGRRDEPSTPEPIRLEQLWNDLRSGPVGSIPADDPGLAVLLAEAITSCSDEVPDGEWFSAEVDGATILVERHVAGDLGDQLLVGLCNRAAQGGGLGRQVAEIERKASYAVPVLTPVIVRASEFPTSPNAAVSKQLGDLIRRGGRRVVVEDSDWRAMLAMRVFRAGHQGDAGFQDWLTREKPLSRLKSMRAILALESPRVSAPAQPPTAPPPPEAEKETASSAIVVRPLLVGTTLGINPATVEIDPKDLVMHAAFLGASGSGKTTVALAIIEQLLLQGIPAILVDRKGDLCRYADPDALIGPSSDARGSDLRDRVDVALYTPGDPNGRPLSIAAVPPGLGSLPSSEREQAARYAASALGGMMNYKPNGNDQARLVILSRAMDLLSQARPSGVTLPELVEFIHDADSTLVNAIGKLDTKHFARLVQDLETIRQSRASLLSAHGEPLDAEALLGLGPHATPGKTRLSIISTKFLGPAQDIQFWVAQFLMEMARWTSRSPSKMLQAVVMFDEADLYLPATRQPPTKEPMENLLKRARSAGLGLLLATQSPGDFDYKCRDNIRTWFVGRVKEPTALAKMKPMLSECRVDVAARLPGQATGEFHLVCLGTATAFRADRSLVNAEQLPEGEILALAKRTAEK